MQAIGKMIKAIVEVCEFNVEKSGVAGAGFSADVTQKAPACFCNSGFSRCCVDVLVSIHGS